MDIENLKRRIHTQRATLTKQLDTINKYKQKAADNKAYDAKVEDLKNEVNDLKASLSLTDGVLSESEHARLLLADRLEVASENVKDLADENEVLSDQLQSVNDQYTNVVKSEKAHKAKLVAINHALRGGRETVSLR